MSYEHKISAASWNLWGKVIDATSAHKNFTIVIEGLAKRGIGDYIKELIDEDDTHSSIVESDSWWAKALYIRYFAVVSSVIELIETQGYSIQPEVTDTAVFIHCKLNT